MKFSSVSFLFLLFVLFCNMACEPIELEEEEISGDSEKSNPDDVDEDTLTVLTVVELASATDDEYVCVGGYIVGYIPSGSISRTIFDSEGAVESNIVIADSPLEEDYNQCAAMQLTKGSDAREDLNLSDNPANLGEYVRLFGTKVAKYYYAPGLKPVYDYEWGQANGDDDDSDDDADNEDTDDEEDDNPSSPIYPKLSDSPAVVLEGC